MTLEGFLREVSKIKGWYILDADLLLRHGKNCKCPIITVCESKTGKLFENKDYIKAAEHMNLPLYEATKIVNAADSVLYNPEMRKTLMDRMDLH